MTLQRHDSVCCGEVMLCECSVLEPAGRLTWIFDSDEDRLDRIVFLVDDEIGRVRQSTSGNFEAVLTKIDQDPDDSQLATFTTSVTITGKLSLNNLTIRCAATFIEDVVEVNQTLKVNSSKFNMVELINEWK